MEAPTTSPTATSDPDLEEAKPKNKTKRVLHIVPHSHTDDLTSNKNL